MRIVRSSDELGEKIQSCKREAAASFGDDKILVEKYLTGPRHIEFQIFADKFGNTVYLFERDCSVQRRHQKVIEEAPAVFIPPNLRKKMGDAAVNAAKAVNYVGAGTVEFMLDCPDDPALINDNTPFYFMEMNTRLQVEHPVTEMITGIDLVALQIKIALGNELPFKQNDLKINGHAIEARVYAENPAQDFLPGSGKLSYIREPNGKNIRVDTGVKEGDEVSVYYDPMIAKLIAHRTSRDSALESLNSALNSYYIGGLNTNINFITKCIKHPQFLRGGVSTKFIESNENDLLREKSGFTDPTLSVAVAAASEFLINVRSSNPALGFRMHNLLGYSKLYQVQSSDSPATQLFRCTGNIVTDNFQTTHFRYHLEADDKSKKQNLEFVARLSRDDSSKIVLETSTGENHIITFFKDDRQIYLFKGLSELADKENNVFRVKEITEDYEDVESFSSGKLVAPMPGKIVKIDVQVGAKVKKNETLVVMEAMKMEHALKALTAGTVKSINVSAGDLVKEGQIIGIIE